MTIIRDVKDLGAFIRRIRKTRGYTQAQLAELAGVGVVYVSQLENGKETAEIGKALYLLQLLSVDLEATDRQSLPEVNAVDKNLFGDDQEAQNSPAISHESEFLALPALMGQDGKVHLAGADQTFWQLIKENEVPELSSEDTRT